MMEAFDLDDLSRGVSDDLLGDLSRADAIRVERQAAEIAERNAAEREERRLGDRRRAAAAKKAVEAALPADVDPAVKAWLTRTAIVSRGGHIPTMSIVGVDFSNPQMISLICGLLGWVAVALGLINLSILGEPLAYLAAAPPVAIGAALAFIKVDRLPLIEELIFRLGERRRSS